LFLIAAITAFSVIAAGCLDDNKEPETPALSSDMQKLNTWKMGDWLHDIDSAMKVMEAAKNGDYGPPTKELVAKLDLPRRAINSAEVGYAQDCWPLPGTGRSPIDTAHANHACLDAMGHKRSATK
jgi:outer membrane murein-binding lipoprotein Lpp